MNCKRCGTPLPSSGYLCSHCGLMMDSNQIEIQKQMIKNNNSYRAELVSEKYGGKKQVFQGREQNENKVLGAIVISGVLLLIIISAIVVYFL